MLQTFWDSVTPAEVEAAGINDNAQEFLTGACPFFFRGSKLSLGLTFDYGPGQASWVLGSLQRSGGPVSIQS